MMYLWSEQNIRQHDKEPPKKPPKPKPGPPEWIEKGFPPKKRY